MKRTLVPILWAIAGLAVGFAVSGPRVEAESKIDNTLNVNGLTVRSHQNASRITSAVHGEFGGTWWTHPTMRSQIAIYTDKSQGAVIGIYKDPSQPTLALDFAIAADGGDVFFQVVDEGKVHQIPVKALLKLQEAPKPMPAKKPVNGL